MAFSRSLLNFFVPLWGLLQLIYLFGDGSGNYAVYRSTVLLLSGNYSLADLRNISLHKWNLLVSQTEKAMAPHSSTLAWRIPWTEEPGRLQSMGSLRLGHNWAISLSLFTFMHWRRKWQPTPVFLPGESQGWGSLGGCRLWGLTESDTTEAT